MFNWLCFLMLFMTFILPACKSTKDYQVHGDLKSISGVTVRIVQVNIDPTLKKSIHEFINKDYLEACFNWYPDLEEFYFRLCRKNGEDIPYTPGGNWRMIKAEGTEDDKSFELTVPYMKEVIVGVVEKRQSAESGVEELWLKELCTGKYKEKCMIYLDGEAGTESLLFTPVSDLQ